jgi:hypothetical protein
MLTSPSGLLGVMSDDVAMPHSAGGPVGQPVEVEDRGSFSHGVCRVCGWSGPGRRSRRVSSKDAAAHRDICQGPEVGGPL